MSWWLWLSRHLKMMPKVWSRRSSNLVSQLLDYKMSQKRFARNAWISSQRANLLPTLTSMSKLKSKVKFSKSSILKRSLNLKWMNQLMLATMKTICRSLKFSTCQTKSLSSNWNHASIWWSSLSSLSNTSHSLISSLTSSFHSNFSNPRTLAGLWSQ